MAKETNKKSRTVNESKSKKTVLSNLQKQFIIDQLIEDEEWLNEVKPRIDDVWYITNDKNDPMYDGDGYFSYVIVIGDNYVLDAVTPEFAKDILKVKENIKEAAGDEEGDEDDGFVLDTDEEDTTEVHYDEDEYEEEPEEESEPEDEEDDDRDIRIVRLAEYLDVDYNDIEEEFTHCYSVDGGEQEWYVLTETEAYNEAYDSIESYIDDVGPVDAIGSYINDYIDRDVVIDWIEELNETNVNDLYLDELVEECINRGLVEPGDVYEIDEEESIEQRRVVYSDNIKEDIDLDDLRDKLVNEYNDEIGDPYEYMEFNFGDDWVRDCSFDENGYIDVDSWIDDVIRGDGVAYELASYNGEEVELGKDEDGEELYGYRRN